MYFSIILCIDIIITINVIVIMILTLVIINDHNRLINKHK